MTIYVVRAGDYAKIGDSGDPERRLRQIRGRHSGCLYPLDLAPDEPAELIAQMPPYGDVEVALHDAFHDLRVRGEWFRYEERLDRWCQRRPYRQPSVWTPGEVVQF